MRVLDVSAVKTLRDHHHQQRSQPFKRARPHLPGKRRHVSSTVGRDTSLKLAPLYLSLLFCVSFLHFFFFFTSTGSATYPTLPVLMCIFTILPLWGSVLYTDVFRSLVVSFRPESARLAASLSLCFVRTPPPPPHLSGISEGLSCVSLSVPFLSQFFLFCCAGFTYLFWNNFSLSLLLESAEVSHTALISLFFFFLLLIVYL